MQRRRDYGPVRALGSRAVERGESLPQPIRDKVMERGQSALKLIDAAEKQAQAEVKRAEQRVWRTEKEARRL